MHDRPAHDQPAHDRPAYDRPAHTDRRPPRQDAGPVCRHWRNGHCQYGAHCKYAHPADGPAPPAGFLPPPLPFMPPPPLPHMLMQPVKRSRMMPPPARHASSRLIIDKIPPEACTIAAVHGHFERFGTIINIDLLPDQSRARIQYAGHEEAHAAFASPDVIFGNRFVKVYWEPEEQPRPHLPPPVPARPPRPADPQEELLRRRQETLKAYLELQKHREALLAKYIAQQTALLERLEAADLDGPARSTLLDDLRAVEAAIEGIKPKAAARPAPAPTQAHTPILRGGPAPRGRGGFAQAPLPPRPPTSYKLDLRPRTIRMAPIPAKLGTDPAALRKFFEPYGQVASLAVGDGDVQVTYVQRPDAERALASLSRAEDEATFSWHTAS